MPGLAIAAAFAFFSAALHAQCSGDDSGSVACQIQQAGNPPASTVDSPAVLGLTEQPESEPSADRSNEATASGSLPSGSAYSEPAAAGSGAAERQHAGAALPNPLTEFQRFVAATTGQILPVYGASLFAGHQASFGPLSQAPAPEDLIVSADDELRIRIWGQVNFSANLRVSREGEIYLPKIGSVHVAGLPFSEVQDHLREAIERVYRNFELSVDLGEIHSIQVYVTGQARQPGEYTVSALSTLVDAVFASGGPSSAGSMRHIQLKRAGKVVTDFDLYELLVKGDKTGDMQLQPGDVLYIPAAGPQVAVLGSVRQPGIYELRGDEPLQYLLDAAGGRTAMALGAHLSIERIEDHARRSAFELTADQDGLNTRLADGDIVRVDPIVSSYRDTVTLRGSVANPGRFRWHAGMRVSDIIPDRESLVTRGYWWRRTQLGLPAPEFAGPDESAGAGEHAGPEVAGDGFEGRGMSTEAEQSSRGSRTAKPAAVLSPGAQTDWNYAVIERLDPATMTTSLISFDLGKLVLDHDASQDRELQPGDVITIFSQDDVRPPVQRQTKYVQLDGEVVNAGIYSVAPGETLRSLVERAGGLTPQAYLYGAEFTRKSTQLLEQERLNEYTDRLEHLMERNSIAFAGEVSGGAFQQNPVDAANRSLVARLRELRATGRIVLNLTPQSAGVSALPELQLEDGDRLLIPPAPSTVQVIGSVFNQNAFLYRRGARVSEYLRLAGGPTREADRGQMFVLRADGSVASRGEKQSVFASSGFDELRLCPGDTIVVPEKMVRPSSLRELMNWTQLMSQFSLSAAAVDVIR
jgi:protein involved in polysaccharide export with SLBB domain